MTFESECVGMETGPSPEPCLFVIFGATGDLARREILPALHDLDARGLLPEPFAVLGTALERWDDGTFRNAMRRAIEEHGDLRADIWERFAARLSFVPVDLGAPPGEDWARLGEAIGRVRKEHDLPDHLVLYLSIPPSFFPTAVERLDASGLARTENGWRRLVVEKPFGRDLASALELDRTLGSVFDERDIFRIDHFLGKETVQNLLVFRFANPSFEPVWNRNHIDHVQITVAEDIGIGTRGKFYEETGVVRDMLQNHLLQLLCFAAIDPPVRFDGDSLRNETVKVLRGLEVTPLDPRSDCVFGQYAEGTIDGGKTRAYRAENDVSEDSGTATFVACRFTLDDWRWSGVPFYLRTGKRLQQKLTEIAITFRPTPHMMFPLEDGRPSLANVLVFHLQPEEGIAQTFAAKQPGPSFCLRPVTSAFRYAETFGIESLPPAYSWLLHDVMQGDSTLFARSDWIQTAWRLVEPILEPAATGLPVESYASGSEGPSAADDLLRRDGRRWRPLARPEQRRKG